MIKIKEVTISELRDFIDSPEYKIMPVIPISRHRGISHINNPMAAGEDRILFLAYDDNQFVGYLGAMPDELVTGDKRVKVAWLSCMWVDSTQRGKGIAPVLLTHAHRAWSGNLLITNFIPVAKKAYDKTGLFTELKSLPGVRGYLRFNLTGIMIAKKPAWIRFRWVLRAIDLSLNMLNEIRLLRWYSKSGLKNLNFEYVADIDEEIMTLVREKSKMHLSPKSMESLQWLIRFPWILDTPYKDLNSNRYAFSSCIAGFNQHYIKIYDPSFKLIAFVVLTYREAHLKTPYIFCDEADIKPVLQLIYAHALKLGIKTLSSYHPFLASAILSSANPFIITRRMNYRFLISKALSEKLGNTDDLIFQDGDGDAAFV
jgi:GNAT superfamily N-acetyltransferase